MPQPEALTVSVAIWSARPEIFRLEADDLKQQNAVLVEVIVGRCNRWPGRSLRLRDEAFPSQPINRSVTVTVELGRHEIDNTAAALVFMVEKASVANIHTK